MIASLKVAIADALTQAAGSAMTERLLCTRPRLRLAAFVPFSILSMLAAMVALVVAGLLVPGLGDRMDTLADQLDETPLRLIEESLRTLVFAVAVGFMAISLLIAACLTWRAPPSRFLWPGRRFDLRLFGIGALLMTAVSALWVPFTLAMGGEWRPPLFDPYYVGHTRITYAAAMAAALLIAAAAEEVVFRGVLLRVSAQITRRPLLICLMNGLLFSAIHLDPDPVSFAQRTLAGMGWTWAAMRLGGLEFAIGSHFANNLFITLIWSPMSAATQVQETPWFVIIPELIATVIVVAVVELLARRGPSPGPRPAHRPMSEPRHRASQTGAQN